MRSFLILSLLFFLILFFSFLLYFELAIGQAFPVLCLMPFCHPSFSFLVLPKEKVLYPCKISKMQIKRLQPVAAVF